MVEAIVESIGLTKRYGNKLAIDSVNLHVPPGVCFGFLGPNGAGKTTMIRMLLGLAHPTSGTAKIRGMVMPGASEKALSRVGGIVEEPRFYPYLTGRQNLQAWAACQDDAARARVDGSLERLGLAHRADEKVSAYSLGMRQRLGVARALLNDPELLVLDEPTNGLDASGMIEFRQLIRDMVEKEGRAVFISSHLLDELEKIVDYVAIVRAGTVIIEGSMRELIEAGDRGIQIDCDDREAARRVLSGVPEVTGVEDRPDGELYARIPPTREAAMAMNRALVEAGIGVASITKREQSLEQRYLEITEGSTPGEMGDVKKGVKP